MYQGPVRRTVRTRWIYQSTDELISTDERISMKPVLHLKKRTTTLEKDNKMYSHGCPPTNRNEKRRETLRTHPSMTTGTRSRLQMRLERRWAAPTTVGNDSIGERSAMSGIDQGQDRCVPLNDAGESARNDHETAEIKIKEKTKQQGRT